MNPIYRATLSAFGSFMLAGAVQAGVLQVTVTDKDGTAIPDVVVTVNPSSRSVAQPAAAPVVIEQRELRFVPFLTVVPAGSTLRFVNRDGYDHHVRSTPSGPLGNTPAASTFELRLDAGQPPPAVPDDGYSTPAPAATPRKRSGATSVDVRVDQAGPIGLSCHLHASMRGQVYVSATPFFGKTDANGTVTIEGVPDGSAEVVVWHADQLQEQPLLRATVSAAPLKLSTQLNSTPRRRRG